MAGFQVHWESEDTEFDRYQHWIREYSNGDDSTLIDNADEFGDLIYDDTPLLINEVASYLGYVNEWVEIYHLGPDPINLNGMLLKIKKTRHNPG